MCLLQTSGFSVRTGLGDVSMIGELSWQMSVTAQTTDDLSVD